MTSVTLAHGTIVELYPDSPPALVIPRLNSRVSITAFDAAVVCSLAADTCRRSNEISPDLFAMLARAGTVTPLTERGATSPATSSLTLSDWAVLRACQYAPLPQLETAAILQLSDHGSIGEPQTRALPLPLCPPSASLWDIVGRRRSVRHGPTREPSLDTISALFAYSMRTEASGRDQSGPIYYRPTASAGARHPIDIYIVAVRVESLAEGIYYYDPQEHSLRSLTSSSALVTRLVPHVCQALTTDSNSLPAFLLLFDLVVDRTGEKYGVAAGGLVLRDLGCLYQQLYLVMTGLDLVGCAIGRVPSELLERVLRLDPDRHIVLGGFAVW
jgi:SagB-type dehydrogenase family enzyme